MFFWGCKCSDNKNAKKKNERVWSADEFYVEKDKLPEAVTRHAKELFELGKHTAELCNKTFDAIAEDGCYTQLWWHSPGAGGDINKAFSLLVSDKIKNDLSIIQIKAKCIWPYWDTYDEPYLSLKKQSYRPGDDFWCSLKPLRTNYSDMPKGVSGCNGGTAIWRRYPEKKLENSYSGFALTVPTEDNDCCTLPIYMLSFGGDNRVKNKGELDMEVFIWDEEIMPLRDAPKRNNPDTMIDPTE